MEKISFNTQKGPRAIGSYSTEAICGDLVFISGQGPIDPINNQVISGKIEEETNRTFMNVSIILEELGLSFNDVLKTTLYLADLNNFAVANKIYEEYFAPNFPARTTIEANRLPSGFKIEIDVIANYRK